MKVPSWKINFCARFSSAWIFPWKSLPNTKKETIPVAVCRSAIDASRAVDRSSCSVGSFRNSFHILLLFCFACVSLFFFVLLFRTRPTKIIFLTYRHLVELQPCHNAQDANDNLLQEVYTLELSDQTLKYSRWRQNNNKKRNKNEKKKINKSIGQAQTWDISCIAY